MLLERKDADLEEGKPTVYDVFLDEKKPVLDRNEWRNIMVSFTLRIWENHGLISIPFQPLSVNLVSPAPPDPFADAPEPLAPEALVLYQARYAAGVVKDLLNLGPKPTVASEDLETDMKLVTGVMLQMPSPQYAVYHTATARRNPDEEDQLPDLVLGCKEVPWRRTSHIEDIPSSP